MGNPYVSADHRDALIVMAGDGMDQLREERDRLKRELDAQTLHLSGYRQWLVDRIAWLKYEIHGGDWKYLQLTREETAYCLQKLDEIGEPVNG